MNQVTVEKTPQYLIVKIPLKAVDEGRAELSPHARRIINKTLDEGLADIRHGRGLGPFRSAKEAIRALKSAVRK